MTYRWRRQREPSGSGVVTYASDTFNRANDPSIGTGAPITWSVTGQPTGIVSNQASEGGTIGVRNALVDLTATPAAADCSVSVKLFSISGAPGISARSFGTGNEFRLVVTGGNLVLRKYNATVLTPLGTTAITFASGDTIKLTMAGNTFNAFHNGVLKIGPVTDAFQNTRAVHGFCQDDGAGDAGAVAWDDFLITA